jgi:autophagy-related protein 18
MCRLIVVLQDKTFIYDLNSAHILEEIDTVHNPKGKNPTQIL